MLTVLQQPNILNPLNASVWYKVNSNLNQLVDFKYVFDVYIKNKSTGTNETYLGRFEAPPRPGDGAGFFSPHKAVRAMAYREVEADLTTPVLAEPNFERFGVNIGESIPQNFDYYDTFFVSTIFGNFVGLTFSYQHPFVINQILFNTQDNSEGFGININPDYEGTFSVAAVLNDFAILTDIPWNLSTPQQTGIITIPFADTWDYISTNGTIGITFSGPHTLQAGDIIEIDKDDKTWNTWLDGEWEVLQVESRSVRLNRGVPLGATYGVGVDSGFITKITRFGHTGTSKWGYLGTRQYDELNVDFSPQFYCGPQYLSSNGATAAGWMTDFEGRKPTWGEEETSSIFLQAGVWYPILAFTPPLVVTGNLIATSAGHAPVNGVWTLGVGDINGRSYWTRGGATMSWTGTGWEIITASGSYFSETDVVSPISITSPMWESGAASGNVVVSGAGFASVNGVYVPNGIIDGKMSYLGGPFNNIQIFWISNINQWWITDTIDFYFSTDPTDYPYQATFQVDPFSWPGPAPVVSEEISGGLALPGPNLSQQTSGGSPVSYQQIFTASVTGQYHFPSGVPNVETYWGVSLSGVKNYEIYLSDIAIL